MNYDLLAAEGFIVTFAKYKEGWGFRFNPYKDDERGVWQIYGEDPNCDFGGHHSKPYLGTCRGTFKEAVEYALTLKGFYTWGGGGSIEKVNLTVLS